MVPLVLAVLIQLNPGDPPGLQPGMIAFPWHVDLLLTCPEDVADAGPSRP